MKLVDLSPEWLTDDMFMFKNPTGGNDYITCKRVKMDLLDQHNTFYPKHKGKIIVQSDPEFCWKFEGNDFNTITVFPSIDASASGNWHGFIINGEIK